jgi:hypothetical protein
MAEESGVLSARNPEDLAERFVGVFALQAKPGNVVAMEPTKNWTENLVFGDVVITNETTKIIEGVLARHDQVSIAMLNTLIPPNGDPGISPSEIAQKYNVGLRIVEHLLQSVFSDIKKKLIHDLELEATGGIRITDTARLDSAKQIEGLKSTIKAQGDTITMLTEILKKNALLPEETVDTEQDKTALLTNLNKKIDDLDISVRSANCLQNVGIEFVYQLVEKTEEELLESKNFGKKSLREIKEILEGMGLGLGMKFKKESLPNPEP